MVVEHNPRVEPVARDRDQLHDLLMDLARLGSMLHPAEASDRRMVSLSEVFALHVLDIDTPLSQQDLAKQLRLEKSTVSRLVTDMERNGLLVRDRDPKNRRFTRLRLTDRGRQAHHGMATAMHQRYRDVVARLSDAERDALLTGLSGLVRVLHDELG